MLEPLVESEQILLSIALNFPDYAHDVVTGVPLEAFTGPNLEIYRGIMTVLGAGGRPDTLSVMAHVSKKSHLAEITSAPGVPGNIEYHAEQLNERLRKIKLGHMVTEIGELITTANSATVQDYIEQTLTSLQMSQADGYIDSKRLAVIMAEYLEKMAKGEKDDGHSTGYHDLDAILGGLRPQELVILGARPSIGKTAFALNVAWNLARKGIKVGFFSSEMSALQLGKRLIAVCSGTNIRQAKSGLNPAANQAVFEIGDSGALFINDTPNVRLSELVRDARLMKRKDGVQVIIVDYISLITFESKTMAGWEKLGEISKKLKQLSRELDLPVIALSQVGRESEGKEPTLADLRYSGAIEQDADVVMFLHRDRDEESDHQETRVIVAKNRNGEIGRTTLIFSPSKTKFYSQERGRG
jgi:replicative DNA helicase